MVRVHVVRPPPPLKRRLISLLSESSAAIGCSCHDSSSLPGPLILQHSFFYDVELGSAFLRMRINVRNQTGILR